MKKFVETKNMNVELLKRIITSQREDMEDLFRNERIIEREVDKETLRNLLEHPNVLVILGVRRCGKSVLSYSLLRDEASGYINFFDERLAGLSANDLEDVLKAFYELYSPEIQFLVFDEIQHVEGWERFISRLRSSKRIIITGSSSQLLSGELATALTGRHVDIELYPFSFREFLKINGVELADGWAYSDRQIAVVKRNLERFLEIGGFPEASKFGTRILPTLYSDILEKDIIKRHHIKKEAAFKEIARYLVSNFSSEFTFSKLKRTFGIKDVHTIKNYVEYMKEAYLLLVVERFSTKLKESFLAPRKTYCIDTGVANAVGFKLSESIGRVMENLVAVELMRRRSYSMGRWEVYYWRDYQGNEVDFVVKEGAEVRQLIQVTYASEGGEVERREIRALLRASDELGCGDLLVVTWDYEEEEDGGKKIRFVPLWKWLIE